MNKCLTKKIERREVIEISQPKFTGHNHVQINLICDRWGNVIFKFQLPSLSESELLSELDPELEPELLLEELPLVVLLSESLDAFGSVEFGSKKKNIEHIKLFEVVFTMLKD